MSLRCSEISSRVGTKLGLATLAAEAVSASLIMLLMLAILFHLHPADGVCKCCSTFRLVGLVMALLRGHTGHLMDWLATNLAYCRDICGFSMLAASDSQYMQSVLTKGWSNHYISVRFSGMSGRMYVEASC